MAEALSKEEAERLRVLPLFKVRDVLTVAMVEPKSLPAQDRLRSMTGFAIRPVVVLEDCFTARHLAQQISHTSF